MFCNLYKKQFDRSNDFIKKKKQRKVSLTTNDTVKITCIRLRSMIQ